jgi:hypothetical protein
MNRISTWRLHLLRAGYLLLVVGLGSEVWPQIFDHPSTWMLPRGIVVSMLGALSALSLLGLRYPLQMLPLLFFEMVWKTIWLISMALPLWTAGRLDAGTAETAFECLLVVIFLPIIPWDYVFQSYVKKAGDPWWRQSAPRAPA